ncbi:MAG TPA: hypothetical protein VL096_01070 [Pirellulaceae bacterium]|nr:hypothetical protein [Pirellulaceae bacterium]
MPAPLTITSPSRLHFGLLNFGGGGRQFGGVGVMVDRPTVQLRITPSEQFAVQGALATRVIPFTRAWQAYHGCEGPLACSIEVLSAPREHAGLGLGTQLAMSVALGLSRFFGLPNQTAIELATSVGRGQRSAVGAYGFVMGGLIAERGKLPEERISPLDAHLDLPVDWRYVLIAPRATSGLANDDEVQAFAKLPPVPSSVTHELARLAREEMLPAAARGDFASFAAAVYAYGRSSGECFAALQGGPYNGPVLTKLVNRLRELGVVGVGQSSWGPTIFALQPSAEAATALVAQLRGELAEQAFDIGIAATSPNGAVVD